MADYKQSTVGKPSLAQIVGSDSQRVDHELVDNYGFQKYPTPNEDQIGCLPQNSPFMVDKPRAALAEAKRQAGSE